MGVVCLVCGLMVTPGFNYCIVVTHEVLMLVGTEGRRGPEVICIISVIALKKIQLAVHICLCECICTHMCGCPQKPEEGVGAP